MYNLPLIKVLWIFLHQAFHFINRDLFIEIDYTMWEILIDIAISARRPHASHSYVSPKIVYTYIINWFLVA